MCRDGITLVLAAIFLVGCQVVGGDLGSHPPDTCATCHRDIVRQWRRSAHAGAWTDEAFAGETEAHRVELCLPCHAPTPLLVDAATAPVSVRASGREHGVDCVACHFNGDAYAGPHGAIGPHPMARDVTRLPCSSFCGRCHEVEYVEHAELYLPSVSSPAAGKSCAGCHMPAHRARLTQGHLLGILHPVRPVHDHAFPTWTETVSGRAVVADTPVVRRRDDGGFEVVATLTNVGAGHRIPTGRFGHRAMVVRVLLYDEAGHVAGEAEHTLLAADEEGLVPGRPTPFTLSVAVPARATVAHLGLAVERVNEDRSFCFTLVERRWRLARHDD